MFRFDTTLRYHFLKSWSAGINDVFETFEKTDWRTDSLNPFVPGISSIWPGNNLRNYTAHYLGLTLAYRFKETPALPPLARGVSPSLGRDRHSHGDGAAPTSQASPARDRDFNQLDGACPARWLHSRDLRGGAGR